MSRPLHILYIGSLPPHPGGSAVSGQSLLRGFAARGHRVRALSAMSAKASLSRDEFALRNPALEIYHYPVPEFYQNSSSAASADFLRLESDQLGEWLPRLLADRPDVALIGREYLSPQALPLIQTRGLPVVIRAAGAATAGIVLGRYPAALTEAVLAHMRRADRVVAVADYQAGWLAELGLSNVQVILNAVDTTLFRPAARDRALQAALGIDDGQQVVLFAGNLNERKRPLDLAQAAALALQRRGDLVFVVAGVGHLLEDMQAACRRLGVEEHFRFAGWVDYSEMPGYFNLADLVVQPSHSEGLSRVYLEAQACGKVLLASDIPAAREVVENGRTGLLFRTGDPSDLAAKIMQAAGDGPLRREIGQRARERVGRHAIETAVEEYLALFESLVNRLR